MEAERGRSLEAHTAAYFCPQLHGVPGHLSGFAPKVKLCLFAKLHPDLIMHQKNEKTEEKSMEERNSLCLF